MSLLKPILGDKPPGHRCIYIGSREGRRELGLPPLTPEQDEHFFGPLRGLWKKGPPEEGQMGFIEDGGPGDRIWHQDLHGGVGKRD